jgi:transcriptional regulator with XRE-family HTH domain
MLMDVVRQIRVTVPDLSRKIKEAREKDGRSAQILATLAGISTAYWYQIEQGKRQWISEETLRGMEQALNISLGVTFEEK